MSLITREDLLDAIEKCQGQKNPNANTCIKLAAYYTILDHTPESPIGYSYASKPLTEFMSIIRKKNLNEALLVLDNLMAELLEKEPNLYYAYMAELNNL